MPIYRRAIMVATIAIIASVLSSSRLVAATDSPEFTNGVEHACLFRVLPTSNTVTARVDFAIQNTRNKDVTQAGAQWNSVAVEVHDGVSGKTLGTRRASLSQGRTSDIEIPCATLGTSDVLQFSFSGLDVGPYTVQRRFERQRFPWEGNTLGLSHKVYAPFMPVVAAGHVVSVVSRRYTMNAFGLWDSVETLGREILSAPITLRCLTRDGEISFTEDKCRIANSMPDAVTYESRSTSRVVVVESRSTVEVDGCMKVELRLEPGSKPVEIERLWVDIPLKSTECPLFHQVGDYVRATSFAGATPAGQGVIWDSSSVKQAHADIWQNSFVPYLWLGAEQRGLAWFAENDKGWIDRKGSKGPLEEIVREGDTVHIRIPLINIPSNLTAPRDIVFGLQASPTKPRPSNWRALAKTTPLGVHVVPWGGLSCPYKAPYHDDWMIVDKIIADKKSGVADKQWYIDYQKKHNVPPVYGVKPWADEQLVFASEAWKPPMSVYHEEMYAAETLPEWQTFQDEWGTKEYTNRIWPDESVLWSTRTPLISAEVTYPRSYQDYGVWNANEWLKRDIGLYWDNDFLKISLNPSTSSAYVAENGKIQPAMTLWNMRDYHKRIWQVFQQWKIKYGDDLVWTVHATTTDMLPIQTWATNQGDIELDVDYEIPADMLRAESLGTQTGNWAGVFWPLGGSRNPVILDALKAQPDIAARIDWAHKMVHELGKRTETGPPSWHMPPQWENIVQSFGYGSPGVNVFNYWADKPVLSVSDDSVKWIVLARPADRTALIVLASWNPQAITATVRFDPSQLGFIPSGALWDAETTQAIDAPIDGGYSVTLPAPYGVRIVKLGVQGAAR